MKLVRYILTIVLLLASFVLPKDGFAFPADESDWIPIYHGSNYMGDPTSDANPAWSNIVGDDSYPAVYTYNDGTYVYYRMRLGSNPAPTGDLKPFGWGLQINTDSDPGTYEYMVMLNGGIGGSEQLVIGQNTIQKDYDDPSDATEIDLWVEPLVDGTNYRVVTATDSLPFNGDADYFLDFRFPYDTFLAFTGLDEESIVSYFIGTSTNAHNLNTDLGETALSTTNLSDGFSEPVLTTGQRPATGEVRFVYSNVSSANWNDDVTESYPEENLYIRVEDNDQNSMSNEVQYVSVTVTTQNGDSETLTLIETGADTGIFTGYITTSTTTVATGDGTLQVTAVETATVTYNDLADEDLNNNQTRTDNLLIKPTTDLSLTKSVDDPTPYANYTVVYSLTVKNNGPSYSAGAQVYDMLPTGVEYLSDDSSGQYNETTGIWYVPIIFENESSVLNIRAFVNGSSTTVTNFANITSTSQPDSNSANDSDSATFSIGGADLGLTKTVVGDDTPSVGGVVQFLLTLINHGDNSATGIEVTDHLPNYLTYSSHTASHGSYSSGTGIWSLSALGNTSSVTLNIFANVTGGSGQTITNFANISSLGQADPTSSNNADSASIYVGGTDVSLSKVISSPAGDPNEGDTVTYTITVSNSADSTATNLIVEDNLPSGITYSSYSSTQGTFNNVSGLWNVGSVGTSSSEILTIKATVDSGTSGSTITNTASKLSMDQVDTNTGNDSAAVSLTVQSADISVDKSVDNAAANSGDAIAYTITVTNNGPSDATNVEVTDNLPSGILFSGYSTTTGAGVFSNVSGTWHAGSISNGSSSVLTIFANVTTGITETRTFYNTAIFTGADQADPVTMNNSDLATVVALSTDLEIFKTVDNDSPGVGDTINYLVTVVNNGPTDATNVVISDQLPTGVSYVSYSSSQGSYSTSGNAATKFMWQVGSITTSQSAVITFIATVDAGTLGTTITNVANIKEAGQGDFNNSNNLASAAIVVGSADLSVTKSVDLATATLYDTLTYTISIFNNSSSNTATGIVIEDQLPALLNYSSYSATSGTFDNVSGFWNVSSLAGGATATLTLVANVDGASCGWTLTNTASLYALDVADPNSANDSGSTSTVIKCADLQVVKIADDATPDEGQNIVYTIQLTNNGSYQATGIEVTDILDSNLTYSSYSSTHGSFSFSNTTAIWSAVTLDNLDSAYLYVTASVNFGSGGVNIPNTATISSSDLSDPTPGNNSSTYTITPNTMPLISLAKLVATISDPVNGGTNPKAIPGAVIEYIISATNMGLGTADAGTVIITDPIPINTEFYAYDLGGWPAIFTDGTTASGLTYTFTSLGDGADSIEFLDAGDNPMTPTSGFDPNVAKIKVTFGGSFNASDGTNHPSFTLKFRVRIK